MNSLFFPFYIFHSIQLTEVIFWFENFNIVPMFFNYLFSSNVLYILLECGIHSKNKCSIFVYDESVKKVFQSFVINENTEKQDEKCKYFASIKPIDRKGETLVAIDIELITKYYMIIINIIIINRFCVVRELISHVCGKCIINYNHRISTVWLTTEMLALYHVPFTLLLHQKQET